MYCQLGNHLFENLNTFQNYSKSGSAVYAEHALLDSKPRLQKTGLALDEITLNMRFHAAFCNPAEVLQALKQSRDTGEILPLLWGNGKVEGSFVITTLTETIEYSDASGNVFSYVVDCTLREFVVKDKLQQKQDDNRKKGTATGKKKPVAAKKKNPNTCAQSITKIVSEIRNLTASVGGGVTSGVDLNLPDRKAKVSSMLQNIGNLAQQLLAKYKDPKSCAYNNTGIQNGASGVYNASFPWAFSLQQGDLTRAQWLANYKSLQANVDALTKAAQPFATAAVTRK